MRRLGTIGAAIAAVLLLGGIAYASIPAPDGTINGCRKNTDGSLRVIDSTATCPSGYTALNWNQTGPQGAPGVSGYQVVFNSAPVVVGGSNPDISVEVWCPAGKNALGGGGQVPGDQDPTVTWVLTYDRPITVPGNPTDPAGAWLVQAHRFGGPSTTAGGIAVWAICATVN